MGRGLSDLQRFVLTRALENAQAEGRAVDERRGADLYTREALHGFYGWPLVPHAAGRLRDNPTIGVSLVGLGMLVFKIAPADRARFRANTVAVSKACARLEERGLVARLFGLHARWAGVSLTEAGRAQASALAARGQPPARPE